MEPMTPTPSKAMAITLRDPLSVQKYFMPNIKGGGVLIETEDLLPMGSELLLMVSLPDGLPRAPVAGKVVWVMPKGNRDGLPPAIGVRFTNDRAGVYNRMLTIVSSVPPIPGRRTSF